MALRFGRIINAVLTLLALALATAAQAKQVALVVANADYEHTSKLSNPVRDATLVSADLR